MRGFSHGCQAPLPNTQLAKDSVIPTSIDLSRPIHTVFNLTTAPWQPALAKLAKIARFPQKSRLAQRKDRAERNLLLNRTLIQGGRLPPQPQHPRIDPLAAWNLEQHGDRGTVVGRLRDAKAELESYFSIRNDHQRKL